MPSLDDALAVGEDLWNTVTDGASDLWDDLFGEDEEGQPEVATTDSGEDTDEVISNDNQSANSKKQN
ncbi:MAG: hypothetical protein KDK39_12060 [Leptospiraceae bacterium]|nr:hypothetical protein [Leptospiraceae bacterium]